MNSRLQQFLNAENITQAQFADTINVARAGVSHILAGRNKPGWEFLTSMLKHYPNLNVEWLLSGNGKMYKSIEHEQVGTSAVKENTEVVPLNLFSQEEEGVAEKETITPRESRISEKPVDMCSSAQTTKHEEADSPAIQTIDNQKKISKIMVFFDDNTFMEIQ